MTAVLMHYLPTSCSYPDNWLKIAYLGASRIVSSMELLTVG
jgi:hypothetical protein